MKETSESDGFKEMKEFISGEINKILFAKDDETDPIWLLNSDVMMDYTSYFQIDNPKNIGNRLGDMKKRRISKRRTE